MEGERHGRIIEGRQVYFWTERLWELSRDLPVVTMAIDDIAEFDQDCWFHGRGPTCREVAEHARRIQTADLSHPVILSADGKLMDGGHRIAKAWLAGLSVIDAVWFEVDPEPDLVAGEVP